MRRIEQSHRGKNVRRQGELPAGDIDRRDANEKKILRKARVVIRSIRGQGQVRRDLVTRLGFNALEALAGGIRKRARTGRNHQILEVEPEQFCLARESAARGGPLQSGLIALGGLWTQEIRRKIGTKIDRRRFEGVAKIRIGDELVLAI